ncbi:hypothetical protein ACCO45_006133 [Purpureocillium lilacinum]|uniref:Uncharacterized protein n=1 Tax=Purpureocillium lilacinum TaxID=33203 RepID=A0ACC4E004_PURLI
MRHTLVLGGLAGLTLSSAVTVPDSGRASFDWSSITPSSNLSYHACYPGFQCARLVLPLDWIDRSDPRTVALAIIKLPADVPPDHDTYGGPIFTNPGGPGGSGVSFIQSFGRRLQSIVTIPGKKHYDIISFDPRGMANSWPRADCLPGDALARDAMLLQIMAYMGTPSVARDMVEMVDKVDELHKREVEQRATSDEHRLELKKRHGADDVPRLQYIGFSYGTLLGNYFASLYPGRIGRLVLDGVCDADDYARGDGWLTSTVDADQLVESFFRGCHEAGPSVCALARPDDSSWRSIRKRFEDLEGKLDDQPLVLPLTAGQSMAVITSHDLRLVISNVIYKPIQQFRSFASALDGLMTGNTTSFAALAAGISSIPRLRDACAFNDTDPSSPQALTIDRPEGSSSVLCADGDNVTSHDADWWRGYVSKQVKKSKIMGAYWSTIRFSCAAWPFRTNFPFKGPFKSPKPTPAGQPVKGRPAAPILFLSNRLDPVTPLDAARRMAKAHSGSRIVVQDALGHCALATADSPLHQGIVSRYLDTGEVPSDQETKCEDAACGPWDKGCELDGLSRALGAFGLDDDRRRYPLGI